MKFGVDFGTTRTTLAQVDRGNYPIVSFMDLCGDDRDYIPSIVAYEDGHLSFGFDAEEAALSGAEHLRSSKRLLADPGISPTLTLWLGNRDFQIVEVVTRFLHYVAQMVCENSSAPLSSPDEPPEAVIGIPAHAWSAQRFLTLEAFKNAGWTVLEMLNEPSAAGFEYTHRHPGTINSKRTSVLVYDLGGGTLDAPLVEVKGTAHSVIASRGDNLLGGDDFDLVLAQEAAKAADISPAELGEKGRMRLIEDARLAKEALPPQSRAVALEVVGKAVRVLVTEYYEAAKQLVDHTLKIFDPLLVDGPDGGRVLPESVAGLYVVGGASRLPLVARILWERFGRRVHRFALPGGSTAIGLAIVADEGAGYSVTDRLSRGVGVFCEVDSGQAVSFDPLLGPDVRWIPGESTVLTRRYRAVHNIGFYRFVEYRVVDSQGVPRGEVAPCGELLMPFVQEFRDPRIDLSCQEILRTEEGPLTEERYLVDENGIVDVGIPDLDTGYTVRATLGR